MSERWVDLEPVDVLFFRDARPFGAGSENYAEGIFPPLPSVTAGALRTAAMASYGADFSARRLEGPAAEVWGRPGEAAFRVSFKGPFLRRGNDLLFPAPADLEFSQERVWRWAPLGRDRLPFSSSLAREGLRSLWKIEAGRGTGEKLEGPVYLTARDMEAWLSGGIPGEPVCAEALWGTERRFGIALGGTRTVREGMLYSLRMVRLNEEKRVRLAVAVEGEGVAPLRDKGILRLGGEGRMARWEKSTAGRWPAGFMREGRFAWTFVTPAIFMEGQTAGWKPSRICKRENGWVLDDGDVRARLVGVRLPTMVPVSGWDIAARSAKPLRLAVPAGAVYYFELERGDPVQKYHARSVSDVGAQEGFGIVLVGGWDYVQA
ncbi:MAG TPA: type III-B CRISPR module-associated protein Cmr3 [Planctomycetota bacterium]|nr:type III-B CRISPR module-associated protein Cmr3 [Planctomycetota bacterium]